MWVSLTAGGAMQGGVKFYRGSPAAARTYVEADRSRADDYYLAEGTGLAERLVGTHVDGSVQVSEGGTLNGDAYERWVAGYDPTTGSARGRLRTDDQALRFVEVVVNGPKTWSLAAALHPEIADAYDTAQIRAAGEVVGWLAEHSTTRVGPRGRQVQVPVEVLDAVVVRHHTSRAGGPHRHLHLQVNARVQTGGRWRGLHSVGVRDSIAAVNGIGHAAVMCDPGFRGALARHGYMLDSATGEVTQLAEYVGAFSARAAQINRHVDRYEAGWRAENPDQTPGPGLRRAWDRRAWAQARPDKVVPTDGAGLERRWVDELRDLGYKPPTLDTQAVGQGSRTGSPHPDLQLHQVGSSISGVDRDAAASTVLTRLGAARSAWNAADIRGETERLVAAAGVVVSAPARRELVEDITARTHALCVPLLERDDVPEHIRALTSPEVVAVEADLAHRLITRAGDIEEPAIRTEVGPTVAGQHLDRDQQRAAAALAGTSKLVVIEGAAGTGKTTTLAAARTLLEMRHHRLVVVTPTVKAAKVAADQLGTDAFSAAWLIHHHGFRWDDDGHHTRTHLTRTDVTPAARLLPGDLLLVDEAGMLDQDTAYALLTLADEQHLRVAFLGDPHQLPAVGRGGVLDLAASWAHPHQHLTLDSVHRFTDPDYADLTLHMRTGHDPGYVFDQLHARGNITVHATDAERTDALAAHGADGELVIAGTREQVATLNAAVRDRRTADRDDVPNESTLVTAAGDVIGVGDLVATRRNDRDLDVANRDRWTVTHIHPDGALGLTTPAGHNGQAQDRALPAEYARRHVELAYATTVHGAQGETTDTAHFLIGDTTGAASTYVAMTRGRLHNTAHLVADTLDDARTQWVTTFSRDRADLGPAHAARITEDDIDRYGPQPRRRDQPVSVATRPPRPAHGETNGVQPPLGR